MANCDNNEWLGDFLDGTAAQAEDALRRIQRVDDLLSGWKELLAQVTSRLPGKAIDLLAENPFWSVTNLGARLEVAYTSAQRAIDRLESAGLVTRVGQAKRHRVYCARTLLAILEEPPKGR
jgi:DNA-binding MarR family transcriptional regulator